MLFKNRHRKFTLILPQKTQIQKTKKYQLFFNQMFLHGWDNMFHVSFEKQLSHFSHIIKKSMSPLSLLSKHQV